MSLRASVTGEIVMQDVEVGEDALLPGVEGLKITNLIRTRPEASGRIKFDDAQSVVMGRVSDDERRVLEGPITDSQVLAVLIEGTDLIGVMPRRLAKTYRDRLDLGEP